MAELPKSVRVGYRTYRVEEWSPAQATAADAFGECDKVNGIIRIRSDLEQALKAEVLSHEIHHAAYFHGQLEPGDSEERVVSVMAVQMTQVRRDNPDWVAFESASFSE